MRGLDTNVIARALLDDDDVQSSAANALIASGERFFVATTVLLELAWVLRAAGMNRAGVRSRIAALVALPSVEVEDRSVIDRVLALLHTGLDVADALHLVANERSGATALLSFDADFVKRAKRTETATVVMNAKV